MLNIRTLLYVQRHALLAATEKLPEQVRVTAICMWSIIALV